MSTEYIDLVTDNDQIIRIECPAKFYDECWDSINHAMKQRDWWSPLQWDGCTATKNGLRLGRVWMGRVDSAL